MSWKARIATVLAVIVFLFAVILLAEGSFVGLLLLLLGAVAGGVLAARAGQAGQTEQTE